MVCAPIFALSLDGYEPYSKDEFPKWSLDLRRAECIFFGGIPIAYPLTALTLGLLKQETSFPKTLATLPLIEMVQSGPESAERESSVTLEARKLSTRTFCPAGTSTMRS